MDTYLYECIITVCKGRGMYVYILVQNKGSHCVIIVSILHLSQGACQLQALTQLLIFCSTVKRQKAGQGPGTVLQVMGSWGPGNKAKSKLSCWDGGLRTLYSYSHCDL